MLNQITFISFGLGLNLFCNVNVRTLIEIFAKRNNNGKMSDHMSTSVPGIKVEREVSRTPHVTLRGSRVREPPSQNGSVCAGADQGAVVGADLDAGDAATVSYSYMGYRTFQVVPHLHQLVISTCHEKMKNMSIT